MTAATTAMHDTQPAAAATVQIDAPALHRAASGGDLAACAALLEQGADPNQFSPGQRTPLHHAIDARNLPVCQLLLGAGALFAHAPSHRPADYRTPFEYALDKRWLVGVRFFLATQGGDPCAARIWQRS